MTDENRKNEEKLIATPNEALPDASEPIVEAEKEMPATIGASNTDERSVAVEEVSEENTPETPEPVEITATDSQEVADTTNEPIEESDSPIEGTNATETAEPQESVVAGKKTRRWRKEKVEKTASEVKWVQVRLIPIWLRLLILLVLMASAAALGAVIGFSVIGDGSAGDVFQKETWQHIFDIMNGK
ncbi:DNA-directed RNA polymerase subunit beta [Sporosarcina sp. GW1-11]|uniref:DNA-directed RNA polymerase subunit beta n=1 Tax=Sporosarcina sp. GW1-11 TaxID=2899126 RepID=UPI00294BAFCC|nr:DNA-directed RNA polymerase subunit beta [Sporosarcina sp. GW1-11]MDV6378252.1 DNA-directed RNA polymerase subunit beta [Sporosarcina sp. GW1-11]